MYADMRAANLQLARGGYGWSTTETVQGTYDWSLPDTYVGALRTAGVTPIHLLSGAPLWARLDNGIDPQYYSNFAAFCAAYAARYASGGIDYIEIWNEPNGTAWRATPDPASYADMLKIVYPAIKAANPNAVVLLCGLGFWSTNSSTFMAAHEFLQGIYDRIGPGFFDAANYHPYTWNQTEINAIYSVMQANGDGNMKIWFTEYGTYTGTDPHAVDASTQAARAQQAIRNTRALPYAGPLIFYDYVDDGANLANSEDNYGITYIGGAHKPAWVTIRDTIANG